MRSTLAFWCTNLFLLFYNLAVHLDDEFANGLIEYMVHNMHIQRTQENYRAAVCK